MDGVRPSELRGQRRLRGRMHCLDRLHRCRGRQLAEHRAMWCVAGRSGRLVLRGAPGWSSRTVRRGAAGSRAECADFG